MFRAANGDGAALSWQACQSHPRPLLAGIKRPLCLGVRRIRAVRERTLRERRSRLKRPKRNEGMRFAPLSVRERGSVLHRTRPKCETRKKGARCAPDFAAKPPREQSSRERARTDARRNEHSASGGAKRKFASGRAAAGVDANTLHFPCRVLRNSPCGCDGGGAGS